jgi:hypothetical protein
VLYLKPVSISNFDFVGDYLAVALGCKVLKAHEAASHVQSIVISFFYSIFLAIEISVHLFEKN